MNTLKLSKLINKKEEGHIRTCFEGLFLSIDPHFKHYDDGTFIALTGKMPNLSKGYRRFKPDYLYNSTFVKVTFRNIQNDVVYFNKEELKDTKNFKNSVVININPYTCLISVFRLDNLDENIIEYFEDKKLMHINLVNSFIDLSHFFMDKSDLLKYVLIDIAKQIKVNLVIDESQTNLFDFINSDSNNQCLKVRT